MAKFFSRGKDAAAYAAQDPTLFVYVRENDFDEFLPNQWCVDCYPSEELGDGWDVADQATLDNYAN